MEEINGCTLNTVAERKQRMNWKIKNTEIGE